MDPVTLIVAALAAGAGDAAQDAGKSAVASLYAKLKAAITGRRPNQAAAGKTLERHAGNPGDYQVLVTDVVVAADAGPDQIIVPWPSDCWRPAIRPGRSSVGTT